MYKLGRLIDGSFDGQIEEVLGAIAEDDFELIDILVRPILSSLKTEFPKKEEESDKKDGNEKAEDKAAESDQPMSNGCNN